MTTVTQPQPVNFLGATARVLATGGSLGLVHMDKPAGEMPPLHVHHNEDEGFYVLGGELTLFLPGESVTLRAGDFFLAPRGVPHAYEVGPDGAPHAGLQRPVRVRALRHRGRRARGAVAGDPQRRRRRARDRDPRPSRRAAVGLAGRPRQRG